MALLEQVDVVDQAYKLPTAISGGQQQRVAIARALANDPPILVADEPTGNLDTLTAKSILKLFKRLVSEGKTIIMVTHDNELVEQATRIITIADGQIVKERRSREIGEQVRNFTPTPLHTRTLAQVRSVL